MKPTRRYTPGVGWHDPDELEWSVTFRYVLCGRTQREILDMMLMNVGSYLVEIAQGMGDG